MLNFDKVISTSLYETCTELLVQEEDFIIVIQNHNNWDFPLPDRLKEQPQFVMKIQEQTLAESYIDEDDKLVILTEFDNQKYMKVLEECDIAGLLMNDMKTPIFMKPFVDYPEVTLKNKIGTNSMPTEAEVSKSMECFRQFNPEMFED